MNAMVRSHQYIDYEHNCVGMMFEIERTVSIFEKLGFTKAVIDYV